MSTVTGPDAVPDTVRRVVEAPAIAGIPIVHELEDGLDVRPAPVDRWTGTRVEDAPLCVRHRLGVADATGLRRIASESAFASHFPYHLDAAGNVVVAFRGAMDFPGTGPTHEFRQLLRASPDGSRYELIYESAPEADWLQWTWQRIILMHALPSRGRGLAAHGCAFLLPDGGAVLCPGISGAGKSTLARGLAADAGDLVRLLSDDRPLLTREAEGAPRLWGSPWASQANVVDTGDGPLRAIVFIHHGGAPELREVAPGDAARRLMRTLAFPFWSEPLMDVAFALLDEMLAAARLYEFSYAPAPGATRWLAAELARRLTPDHANR